MMCTEKLSRGKYISRSERLYRKQQPLAVKQRNHLWCCCTEQACVLSLGEGLERCQADVWVGSACGETPPLHLAGALWTTGIEYREGREHNSPFNRDCTMEECSVCISDYFLFMSIPERERQKKNHLRNLILLWLNHLECLHSTSGTEARFSLCAERKNRPVSKISICQVKDKYNNK